MPIMKAAIKAMRQSAKHRGINRTIKSKLRDALKEIAALAAAKKNSEFLKMLPQVTSMIDKAVKHHILHRNTAGRKKSALSRLAAKK